MASKAPLENRSYNVKSNGDLLNGTDPSAKAGPILAEAVEKLEEQTLHGHDDDVVDAASSEPKGRPQGLGIPIEDNVFYNEETLKYMRIIDMYKRLGIGKDIELPRVRYLPEILYNPAKIIQLVIAGAQSCGKSSLLENLTGLPVPITSGIGTRFPIEITLIEDAKKFQIKPSIILDPKAHNLSLMDKEKVQKFNLGRVYNEPMVQSEFEDLLRDVSFPIVM
jgi:hypothetical protein